MLFRSIRILWYNSAPDDYVIAIAPENRDVVAGAYVHHNIRIEDNEFDTRDGLLLTAKSVDGLIFLRNRVVARSATTPSPYRIVDCAHVRLQKNNSRKE